MNEKGSANKEFEGLPSLNPDEEEQVEENSFVMGFDSDPEELTSDKNENRKNLVPNEPEIPEEEKETVENKIPITTEESEPSKQNKSYAELDPIERQDYITEHAPKMDKEDLLTEDGRVLDFGEAGDLNELIQMISAEKTIKNGVGQEIPSGQILNLVYDRLINRNDPNKDWTKITLRHRLRETVYRLAENYMIDGKVNLPSEIEAKKTQLDAKLESMNKPKQGLFSKVKSWFRR